MTIDAVTYFENQAEEKAEYLGPSIISFFFNL